MSKISRDILSIAISIFLSVSILPNATANELETVRQKAIGDNTYFKEETYCHSINVNGELQALINNQWRGIKSALGWDTDSSCPESNLVRPWTRAVVPEGTQLRWRVWFDGAFDWTSETFIATKNSAPADEPLDTVIKEVKPPLTTKSDKSISKTIRCSKGKKIKEITEVSPRCPKGYKQIKKR
ncbi:MAG: hypothetical protein ACO3RD_04990 [Candidatus Nanopelagicaceae bacterium]|jgi:hypothetical protein